MSEKAPNGSVDLLAQAMRQAFTETVQEDDGAAPDAAESSEQRRLDDQQGEAVDRV